MACGIFSIYTFNKVKGDWMMKGSYGSRVSLVALKFVSTMYFENIFFKTSNFIEMFL